MARCLKTSPIPNRPNALVPPRFAALFCYDRSGAAGMDGRSCAQPGPLQESVKYGWTPLFTPPPPPSCIPREAFQAKMRHDRRPVSGRWPSLCRNCGRVAARWCSSVSRSPANSRRWRTGDAAAGSVGSVAPRNGRARNLLRGFPGAVELRLSRVVAPVRAAIRSNSQAARAASAHGARDVACSRPAASGRTKKETAHSAVATEFHVIFPLSGRARLRPAYRSSRSPLNARGR